MLTKEKFQTLLEEIDQSLIDSPLHFHQRPMHTFTELTKKLNSNGRYILLPNFDVSDDDYSDSALYTQVNRWYENRYGDRIKVHPGPGSFILMIKGEAWEVELPLCFGTNSFTIDADLKKVKRFVLRDKGVKVPEINILWHVKSMTNEIASSLSDNEKIAILQEYMYGLNAVQSLRDIKNAPFMEQAKNDYDIAINNIFIKYPDYNNSKWASLQMAEKCMKSKLISLKVDFKKNHKLSALASSLATVGVVIPKELIEVIQCSAGVRYGETTVSKLEAINSVKSALDIFCKVFTPSSYEKKS